jgi:hypothetical protein
VVELNRSWVEEVCAKCDPIFEAAGVGFSRQILQSDPGGRIVSALLWEADPGKFAARYPDSGIVESYGEDQWRGVHCIDFWVHLDHADRTARICVEGWNLPEVFLRLRGDGFDAMHLADLFARILGVPSPRA